MSGEAKSQEELHKAFQKRVDAGERVEPTDWMPEEYRNLAIGQIHAHANSETIGMLVERQWAIKAPTLARKAALLAKIQDEGGHGLYLYAAAETLGVTREQMTEELIEGRSTYAPAVNYPALSWADAGCVGWLIDGGAILIQVPLCRSSYGPYARAMIRICHEESFHQRQGFDIMDKLCKGTEEQRQMAQEALNRWWWPALMIFGARDEDAPHLPGAIGWKLLRFTNNQLRQRFLDAIVPQIEWLGLKVPDPDLEWDETKNDGKGGYSHGKINWGEYAAMLWGDTEAAQGKIGMRRRAWRKGAWVREAARVHAEKRKAQSLAAE